MSKKPKSTENNTSSPFFSIIIPTLNEEKYLPRLLSDLAKQTFTDFEVIIVDAKSKDKTCKNAQKYKSKFKDFHILISNKKSVSYQRNHGAKKASAEWIIFFDADNQLPQNFLREIKTHITVKNADILSSLIHYDLNSLGGKISEYLVNFYIKLQKLFKQNFLLESFICVKSNVFQKLGGFDKHTEPGEGGDFLKRSYKNNYIYSLVDSPKYTYSLRRAQKEGFAKLLMGIVKIEIFRLLNYKAPDKFMKALYPMEGGAYYKEKSKE